MHVFVILMSFSINLDENMILPFSPKMRGGTVLYSKSGKLIMAF